MEPEATPVDSLTVPETTLLQHLQRGAPDAEIAVRLGLPIGEEKARVHALFGRLGIESRNGLATWDGVVPAIVEPPEEPPAPPGATAETLVEPTPRNYARLLPLAIFGFVVIASGAFVATAREGGSPTLAPSAALRTIDQFGAPAAYVDGVPLPRLRIGAITPLPTDLALVQWETRSGVVRRTYRSQEGTIHLEDLFVPPFGGTVTQVAATPDGREMVVAVSSPRTSGLSPIVTVFRSNDGGATWANLGATGEGAIVTGLGPANVVIALDSADGSRRVELLPGRITVRGSAQLLAADVTWKVVGTAIQQQSNPALTRYSSSAPFADGGRFAVHVRGPGAEGVAGIGVTDDQGILVSGFSGDVRAVVNVVPGGLIAADLAVVPSTSPGDESGQLLPALIDPTTGVAHPIETAAPGGREQPLTIAFQRGPLVHIGGGEGGCAPVRDRPVIEGSVLYCAPDGMALRPGETRVHNDYTWVRVMSGRERPGWVDLSYVRP